ncbi:MAG: hemin uptake protein HemP [Cypionkella sp.]|uniref:hemin uptake protein HemP n=1 Tax=Cypionkella sp. TaxID=2811411 RepID=UPI002AB8D2DA|nr:hemin uptake protein HemP [Cypionkella sp.]MDZ4308994.1 hemin uptake protein HemP [Cypionkella sp.]MDZ4392007.1 hemin uptake protein HemP [Cypionkella sp.]
MTPQFLSSQSAIEPVPNDRILRYDARTLTGGAGTALIELDGQIYTLRITKSAKLILTK